MSEFNTGKPPAGEAGMLLYNPGGGDRFDFKYSRGDGTFCCGSNCAFAAAAHSRSVGSWEAPSQYWRWATLAELTASGIPESEARGMVHKSMLRDAPWLPPQVPGYGRLICLKLTPTEQAEPTAAEVEATQKPQSPEDFVRDMERDEEAVMATDQNEAMKNRDALKRAITPPPKDEGWREYDPKYPPIQPYRMDFKTVVEGDHVRHFYRRADTSAVDVVLYARNGLILVAQWTNRLGGNWGAFE